MATIKKAAMASDVLIEKDTGALVVTIGEANLDTLDVVQTDVAALVDGVGDGKTLADVFNALTP